MLGGLASALPRRRFQAVPISALWGRSSRRAAQLFSSSAAGGGDGGGGGRAAGIALFGVMVSTTFGLGTWQLQRSKWKEDLMADRKRILQQDALPLKSEHLAEDSTSALHSECGRKVLVEGTFDHSRELLVGLRGPPKDILPDNGPGGMSVRPSGYYVLTPLVRTDGSVAIVNRGWVPREAAVDGEWSRPVGHVEVIGVLSGGEKQQTFSPVNDLNSNIFLWVDLPAVAKKMNLTQTLLVEVVAADDTPLEQEWPLCKRDVHFLESHVTPQTHLMYAATWYTLGAAAAALTYMRFRSRPRPRSRFAVPPISSHPTGGVK